MVVEDDPAIRQLLVAVLEGAGHAVVEVADGTSALPAAREALPDLVLCDIGLPGIDGFEVLGLLKDDPALRHVPVIMVTAWAEPALVAKALERGAHDYVRKPFDIGELSARVEAALRARSETDFLAHDRERLAEAAATDPLTGLPNRRRLDGALDREATIALRTGRPFSVVMIDLDGLEAVNEALGHDAGDAVLSAAGDRLRQRMRAVDVIGRVGGDELLAVLSETGLGGAGALAEDLRTALAGRPLDTPGGAVRMTACFGVAELQAGECAAEVVARAEAALAQAKAAGRDAVRLSRPAVVPVLAA